MIPLTDFATLTKDLHSFFGRKYPYNSRIEIWHDSINRFKEEDVRGAFDWIEKNLDSMPNNLPKAINSAIFEANRHSNTENKEYKQHQYGYCDDCNGTGMFKLRMCSPHGLWYEPIQFCSKCDNWKNWTNSPKNRISRTELEAMNIMFQPYNKPLIANMETI